MTDFLLLSQMHKMIKEMSKPRLMFRKGVSARGFFRPYMSFSEYTRASILKNANETTPVAVRFSSMLGDGGTADTVRNIKEMDIKFMAGDGTYDMLCQSLPVFLIDDSAGLIDLCEAFSAGEFFDGIHGERFWSFLVKHPAAFNCAIRLFSHEGLSDSFVDINWYSVNIAEWENNLGEKFLVRYQWIPVTEKNAEQKKLNRNTAEFMAGFDPHRAVRNLEDCVLQGKFPAYELYVQILDYKFSLHTSYTKRTLLWSEAAVPYITAGIMKLTHLPEDFHRESDMLSFAPGNTIDGIGLYRDAFSDMMDYIYRTEALERGASL